MNATAPASADAVVPARQRKLDLQRSLVLCTREAIVAMPIVTMSLPVNVFLSALLAKGLDLSKPAIGFITALPYLANCVQLPLMPLLARWRRPQRVTVVFAWLQLVCWLALGIGLPWLPRHEPGRAALWIAVWFAVSSLLASICGVAWNAWMQEWIPGRLRGKYFGYRNRFVQVSTLVFSLVCGWVLAHWDYSMLAFQGVIFGAVFLRTFSLRWQWISPTRPTGRRPIPVLPLAGQLELVRASRSLLLFVAFGAVWQFAFNCFAPFAPVFLFEQLSMSAWDYGVLCTLAALGGALSLPAWGPLLDRYGNKSVMVVSLVLWQVQNYLFCLLTPERAWWTYGMWLWGGATGAGFLLGQFTLLLKLIPPAARNMAIAVNLAITSVAAAAAPIIGGEVLSRALHHWPDAPLGVYHAVFAVQPTLALLGALLLLRVQEPAASPLASVVGAMRNIRTLSGVLGLSFFTHSLFVRRVGGGARSRSQPPTPTP